MATHTAMTQGNDPNVRGSIERAVGILHFASPKEQGWNGVLRKRFTDFQVHEIDEDGQVVHLNDYFKNAREYESAHSLQNASIKSGQHDLAGSTAKTPDAAPKASGPATEPMTGTTIDTTSDVKGETQVATTDVPQDKTQDSNDATAAGGDVQVADAARLAELLGDVAANELIELDAKIRADPKAKHQSHGTVKLPQITDRAARTAVHSEIRRIFSSRIETETNSEGIIQAKAQASRGGRRPNAADNRSRQNQQRDGQPPMGKFLHFSLYKENKDTMEAISHLARELKMKPSFFGTAGTKDRRAVTVQRVSIRGRNPKSMVFVNSKLMGIKIGDFKFSNNNLFLGSHNGNEFTIVMKDCTFQGTDEDSFERKVEIAQSTIDKAVADIGKNGFINYFGTQRFGTFEIGTHVIGMKILKGDFKGAVDALLSFDPSLAAVDTSSSRGTEYVRYDDVYRAKALSKYQETGNAEEASKSLPRRCNTEFTILKHLTTQRNDFHGAILSITRNMRSMYLHAYQSFIWNFVASKRWELYGASVVKGDLVFDVVNGPSEVEASGDPTDDEENIHLGEAGADSDGPVRSVRALTEEDVKSGRYSILDVVLPSPGTDVVYPDNEIGEFYKEFMAKEECGGLDPHNMRRSQKAFSLTGDYRKFMGSFISAPKGSVRTYLHDHDQLVPTDVDLINERRAKHVMEIKADQPASGSKWQTFANNVQEDERRQARENVAMAQRRKAETSGDDVCDSRMSDTWVQTSVDGSNKRVRVEAHATQIVTGGESDQGAEAMDLSQAESVTHSTANEGAKRDEITRTSTTEVSEVTVIATLGGWWTALKKSFFRLYNTMAGRLLKMIFTDTSSHKANKPSEQSSSDVASKASERAPNEQAPGLTSRQGPAADTTASKATITASSTMESGTSNSQVQAISSEKYNAPVPSEPERKIAVVLQFSLPPSAYATNVLRELQG